MGLSGFIKKIQLDRKYNKLRSDVEVTEASQQKDFTRVVNYVFDPSTNEWIRADVLNGGIKVTVMDGDGNNLHLQKHSIQLKSGAIALTEAFMLINLSDTTLWPHDETTGVIHIYHLDITINPTANFRGEVSIGYLKNVDGDNGDFTEVFDFDFLAKAELVAESDNFNDPVHMGDVHHFGSIEANDTLFRTGVNITGPQASSTPSGNGDVVLKIVRTAGTSVEVNIFLQYEVFVDV